jgi:DNA polymerase I-like protein with 3'-5' exonuclease and polymerase domains
MVALGFRADNNNFLQYKSKFAAQFTTFGTPNRLLVGFNLKFDLHWLQKYNIEYCHCDVWDCQLAEYILSNQTNPFPSLDDTCVKYGLGEKIHGIKEKYWDNEINTDAIPKEELLEYLERDLELTEKLFLYQQEQFKKYPKKYELFKLQCEDLKVLQQIEWNGLLYNREKARKRLKEYEYDLQDKEQIIKSYAKYPSILNINSSFHISALLHGGLVKEEIRCPVGQYQSGLKVGQIRYKIFKKDYQLPRLIEPLPKTELKTKGYWSVDDKIIRKLKIPKEYKPLIAAIESYAKIEKLRSTYFQGMLNLFDEKNWADDFIHGSMNQCSAITGRLSSSQPNLQNLPDEAYETIESRYTK